MSGNRDYSLLPNPKNDIFIDIPQENTMPKNNKGIEDIDLGKENCHVINIGSEDKSNKDTTKQPLLNQNSSSEEKIPEKQQGWLSWGLGKVKSGAKNLFIKFLPAAITAAPSAVNAACAVTDIDAKNISLAWWRDLSNGQKASTIWSFSASMLINIKVAYDYVPRAVKGLFGSVKKCCNSCKDFLGKTTTLTLANAAALAAFAIAFNSLTSAGAFWSWGVGSITFFINFAVRYVGVKNFVNTIIGLRNKDLQETKELTNTLRRIEKKLLPEANKIVKKVHDKHKSFSDRAIVEIFTELQILSQEEFSKSNTVLFKNKTNNDIRKEYASTVFDLTVAFMAAGFAFPTFLQKGYDGINVITKKAGTDLDGILENYEKIGVGFVSGSANAMLYGMAAFNWRQLAWDVWHEISDAPKEKIAAILEWLTLGILNYYASSSMENVAKGILKKEDRLCQFIAPNTKLGDTYWIMNRIGAGLINMNSCNNTTFGHQPDFHGLISTLRKKDVNDMEHFQDVLKCIRPLSFFDKQSTLITTGEEKQPNLTQNPSTNTLNNLNNENPENGSNMIYR